MCTGSISSRLLGLVWTSAFVRTAAWCRLPIEFPADAGPSGATMGPHGSLVIVSDGGAIEFVDLEDFSVREDQSLNDRNTDAYGWFDLEGVAMTNSQRSPYLYIGLENKPAMIEYDWKNTRRIFRKFDLPGLGSDGVQSLTWVPSAEAVHLGYFYVGSRAQGKVFIYEVPLLEDVGPGTEATLKATWEPLKGSSNIAGLSYSGGYLFLNYDDGVSNHVLIYPVMENGMYGDLAEQYQVDVANAQGIAVRQRANETWEVLFSSDAQQAVFAYDFRFITGFELHHHCKAVLEAEAQKNVDSGSAELRPKLLVLIIALGAAAARATAE